MHDVCVTQSVMHHKYHMMQLHIVRTEKNPVERLSTWNTFVLCCRSTTPQQWEDFSRYNVDRANAEMGASQRLREATHLTIHNCDNDLEAQRLAVDYALRKRIHEAERALDELKWQKKNVSDELSSFDEIFF